MILLMHSLVLLIIQCWLASERVSNTDYNTLKFSFFKCSVKIQFLASAAAAKLLQSCPTLCRQPTRLPRPWDSPGKDTGVGCHFLLQCMKVKVKSLSHVRPLATPWTAAYQAPPSMRVSRQKYWSGLPLPSPKVNLIIPRRSESIWLRTWSLELDFMSSEDFCSLLDGWYQQPN